MSGPSPSRLRENDGRGIDEARLWLAPPLASANPRRFALWRGHLALAAPLSGEPKSAPGDGAARSLDGPLRQRGGARPALATPHPPLPGRAGRYRPLPDGRAGAAPVRLLRQPVCHPEHAGDAAIEPPPRGSVDRPVHPAYGPAAAGRLWRFGRNRLLAAVLSRERADRILCAGHPAGPGGEVRQSGTGRQA